MKKKALAGLGVVVLCVASVFFARHFFSAKIHFTTEERALLRSHGDPDSPIWIVEYLDYQCPPCRVASGWIRDAFEKHPSLVYDQVRFYPLTNHPYGLKAAIYAECAARQGKFWKFHETLFDRQAEWSPLGPEKIDAMFESYAVWSGVDMRRLGICVENPATKEAIFEEIQSAKAMGVAVTPTFFVNGRISVGLEGLSGELDRVLRSELEKKR